MVNELLNLAHQVR